MRSNRPEHITFRSAFEPIPLVGWNAKSRPRCGKRILQVVTPRSKGASHGVVLCVCGYVPSLDPVKEFVTT